MFHATDGMVVSGAGDNKVRVWLTDQETAVAVLDGHSDRVQGVALVQGGGLITSVTDKEMLTWSAPRLPPAWQGCGCHGKCLAKGRCRYKLE